jgi:uncharacterized protein (DUF2126 family)/transglutaminase-like putative cysteine protease
MSILVAVNHRTQYKYDRPVAPDPHLIRLRPAAHSRTPVRAYSLNVGAGDHYYLHWQQDAFNNWAARLSFDKGRTVRELSFEVDLVAEILNINPFDFRIDAYADVYPFTYEPAAAKELAPFREAAPPGPLLQSLIDECSSRDIRTVDHIVKVNQIVHGRLKYVLRMDPGVQAPEQTLAVGRGSCRDYAWLMVNLLRHLGYAARFVSGYSIQLAPDIKSLDGPSGVERDVVDLHAWTEVYLPGAGWVAMDATSGMLAGGGYIPMACTADPGNAAPITGTVSFATDPENPDDKLESDFSFSMTVTRLPEAPRSTKPYAAGVWEDILALGRKVDERLTADDVRLTMGGEPTFVSIDDMDGAEWNTAAMGPTKRALAGDLLRRMRARFAPGGLLHFGQGKWYPGESLPRWSLGCWWRTDGVPIWRNVELVADERRNYGVTDAEALAFVTALADRLGVDPGRALPGYEDVWHYLLRERRLPTNVDPLNSNLDDPEERKRLSKIFAQGLGRIIGYALPLRRTWDGRGWQTGNWFFRREHMFLLPGDSPMGFRLPLDSLPWIPADQREPFYEPDPFDPRGPLREPMRWRRREGRRPGEAGGAGGPGEPYGRPPVRAQTSGAPWPGAGPESEWEEYAARERPQPGPLADVRSDDPAGIVRTALCVEPRQGRMHVFMPPARTTEDYLDLVAAVEDTAEELSLPVLLEGYEPAYDPRLKHFRITPDPGVIEVNVHPAGDWAELTDITTGLYEEARLSRLGTEKFMLDGRHTGTGGGNHIVIGGPTAADSPILRRPDLLASLVGYWHNHPSLSYLFSSQFIGPTSQAPRIDEARNDSLYELELAVRQVPDPSRGALQPWLVDRIFRNILTDVTGNTHRSEFCIDKLYSPDGPGGRHGLLELRAFEMPPHPQMSCAQQLLLRSAVARFWREPYRRKPVRWGTELHDRFMLPHFLWQDFCDVLDEMADAGFELKREWFRPHLEFRFPEHGHIQQRDVTVELRHAIEPWHVLGEETTATGTARYVDSSVERLQVLVRGMVDDRHVIACNGRRVPLHPTGTVGEYVAGVRYRAWQPPSCLHPLIPVDTPLTFDLLDTWAGRSVGGCRYHVSHPDGRNYTRFPVNAAEAESRRLARFFPFGHTPGPMPVPPPERDPEFPLTLDLRR